MKFSSAGSGTTAKTLLLASGALVSLTALSLAVFALSDARFLSSLDLAQILSVFAAVLIFLEMALVAISAHLVKLARRVRAESDFEAKAIVTESANRQLENSLKDLSVLYHTLNILSYPLEQSELFYTITRLLPDVAPLKKFSLLFLSESKEEFFVAASFGFKEPHSPQGRTLSVGEGVIGQTASERRLLYLPDAMSETRDLFYGAEEKDVGSFLSIPLLVSEELIGVLNVAHEKPHAYSATDIQLIESIAGQIALAYDRSKLYMKTKELSVRDELTGIYNRRHFHEMLHLEWRRSQRFERPLALLMIDVDYFKNFNDRYGHIQGDQALKGIARLLVEHVREVDTVARFGGEEFVILLADTTLSEANHVAEKLRTLVANSAADICPDQTDCNVSISVGVSAHPDFASNEEELINTADMALYQAKASGRNRVKAFNPEVTRSTKIAS